MEFRIYVEGLGKKAKVCDLMFRITIIGIGLEFKSGSWV